MKGSVRGILVVVLVVGALSLSGCLFNIFQTARTIGSGNVALTIGSGSFNLNIEEPGNWYLTPQARLTIGMADGLDLGLQTGLLVGLDGADPGWLGAIADLKFAIVDDPETFSLAMGIGGSYGIETFGWGLLAEVFFDSNARLFPVFIAYQPNFTFADGFAVFHHVAGGLKLRLSPNARVLIQVDARFFGEPQPLTSYGIALEIGF
jgi:hypothetical protein